MTRQQALQLIDDHKNELINPVEMLQWVTLRVIILSLSDETWNAAQEKAAEIMSQ